MGPATVLVSWCVQWKPFLPCQEWSGWVPGHRRRSTSSHNTLNSWSVETQKLREWHRENKLIWAHIHYVITINVLCTLQDKHIGIYREHVNYNTYEIPCLGPENSTSGSSQIVPSLSRTAVAVVYERDTRFFPWSSWKHTQSSVQNTMELKDKDISSLGYSKCFGFTLFFLGLNKYGMPEHFVVTNDIQLFCMSYYN